MRHRDLPKIDKTGDRHVHATITAGRACVPPHLIRHDPAHHYLPVRHRSSSGPATPQIQRQCRRCLRLRLLLRRRHGRANAFRLFEDHQKRRRRHRRRPVLLLAGQRRHLRHRLHAQHRPAQPGLPAIGRQHLVRQRLYRPHQQHGRIEGLHALRHPRHDRQASRDERPIYDVHALHSRREYPLQDRPGR